MPWHTWHTPSYATGSTPVGSSSDVSDKNATSSYNKNISQFPSEKASSRTAQGLAHAMDLMKTRHHVEPEITCHGSTCHIVLIWPIITTKCHICLFLFVKRRELVFRPQLCTVVTCKKTLYTGKRFCLEHI